MQRYLKLGMLTHAMAAAVVVSVAGQAMAALKYELTLVNGSKMPISPAVIYVKDGQIGNAPVGSEPSLAFTQLCQTGNPEARSQELRSDSAVKFLAQTTGPILPGESKAIEIEVHDPLTQSVHFEAMYGKTKDACAVGTVGSHGLYSLKAHVTSLVQTKDSVVQTGAFTDPSLPAGRTYLDPYVCQGVADAVTCLRGLSMPTKEKCLIRSFTSYLPSLVSLLEMKYGASEVQSLIIPESGAVQVQLGLKH